MKTPFDEYFNDESDKTQFIEWAFPGIEPAISLGSELLEAWNKAHGHEYKLYGNSRPRIDYPKMVQLWLRHRLKNNPILRDIPEAYIKRD